jgi:DNA-binding response OmpR family regulator
MPLDKQQIQEALANRRVLIVEDNGPLSGRLASLIQEYTHQPPVIAHSVEWANKSVKESQPSFELAIVDVMLPLTQENFLEIEKFEVRVSEIQIVIDDAILRPDDETSKNVLSTARANRAYLIKQIDIMIDQDAGIDMAEKWRKSAPHFPILFLTAVGSSEKKQRGLNIEGGLSDWMVKFAPSELILEKCFTLLKTGADLSRS